MILYYIMDIVNNYNYLVGLFGFLSAWLLGIKFTLLCLSGYLGYQYNQKSMWTKFTFMLTWYLFGFLRSLFYVFMVAVYEFIFRKDKIIENSKKVYYMANNIINCVELCDELQSKYNIENKNATPEEKELAEKYERQIKMFINYWKLCLKYCNLVKEKYNDYVTNLSHISEKYNISHYLLMCNNYLGMMIVKLISMLYKIPYVEKFVNDYKERLLFFVNNEDKLILPKVESEKPTNNNELSALFKEIENIQPPPFLQTGPPSEKDVKDLNDMIESMNKFQQIFMALDQPENKLRKRHKKK